MMSESCVRGAEIGVLKEQIKQLVSKMDKYEKTQDALFELSKSVAVIAKELTHIGEDVKDVKAEVGNVKEQIKEEVGSINTQIKIVKENQNTLENKQDKEDATDWKDLWKQVRNIIIGAVTYYILSKWGM